jgi:hypothetical protein
LRGPTHNPKIANRMLLADQADLIARLHGSLSICDVHKNDRAVAGWPICQPQPLVVDVDKQGRTAEGVGSIICATNEAMRHVLVLLFRRLTSVVQQVEVPGMICRQVSTPVRVTLSDSIWYIQQLTKSTRATETFSIQ